MAGSAHGGHGHREEICSDILSFVHRNMLRRCPRVLKQINQISSSAQIPASRARDSRRPASLLQAHVLLFLFFFKCTSLKFRNIGCIFFLLFSKNIFHGSRCSSWLSRKTTAALLRTLWPRRQKSHWLPGGHSNRPHPIRRRRKDDPNNASSDASGQRADTPGRPRNHASAPYLLCLPPPERREPTCVSPRITLQEKAGGGDWLLAGTNKVHSDLVKRRSHSASVSSHC